MSQALFKKIPDTKWEEFTAWWKSRWRMTSPDRFSVEAWLQWDEDKCKNIDFKWSFTKEKNTVGEDLHESVRSRSTVK